MFIVLLSNFHTSACTRVFRTNTLIFAITTLSRDPARTQKNSAIRKSKNQRSHLMKYYWNQMINRRKKTRKYQHKLTAIFRPNWKSCIAFISVRPLNICLLIIEKLKLVRRHIKCLKTKIKITDNIFSIRTLCFFFRSCL